MCLQGKGKFTGVPTYSLTVNNRNKRAEYSEDLHAESVQVNRQVCRLNSEFEELNRPLGFNTLKFDADLCPVRLGSTKKRMLLTEEIGIEKSIERISGIRTIQNGGRGIN